ncbi:MAG: hypothetical protein L0L10_05885 [Tetragenococcus sp.]|nr:hypothetical protein [Tetragenococcus sp.]
MKTNEIIEENTNLQNYLTKTNEKYYGNLLTYVRAKSLFRDEQKSEQLLLDILQDLVEAQKSRMTAEEYFGKNPKQIADEIVRNLPINPASTLKTILYSLGAFLLFALLPELIFPTEGFDIGSFLITGVYTMLFVLIALYLLGYSVYRYQSKLIKVVSNILFALGIAIGVGLLTLISTPWRINLSGRMGVFVICLTMACLIYLFYRTKNKRLWSPFIPLVLITGLSGIASRTNKLYTIFSITQVEKGIATALICGLILQGLLIVVHFKKK